MATPYSNLFRIPSLSGDNYHTWAVRAKAALIREETWHAIDPGFSLAVPDLTGNDKKANDKALSLIFSIIDDTFLDDVGQCVCAREAWQTLEELNTKHGLLHILQLMRELFNVRMKTGELMKDYLGRLMEIHRKLEKCGYGYNDKELACMMLIGLPESYEQLILSLEHKEQDLNTKEVKAKLLLEEKRKASREEVRDVDNDAKVLFTKKDKPKGSKSRQQDGQQKKFSTRPVAAEKYATSRVRRNTKCYDCLEFGHIAKECPLRANADDDVAKPGPVAKAKRVAEKAPKRALCATQRKKPDSGMWYLDSGCTEHMTSSRRKLTKFRQTSSTVEVANGEKLDVAGMGTVELVIKSKNGGCTVTLEDVLYAPGLDGNLLSIGRIEEKGMNISFHNGKATITDEKGETFIWTTRKGRLYSIEEEQCAKAVKHVDTDLWHRRLGHLHMEAVRKLHGINDTTADYDIISGEDAENAKCTTCMKGKLRRKKFAKKSDTRATDVLGLIHSDVMGPIIPVSKGGSKYIVTFIDDRSRYTEVYFMKNKSEVLEKFKQYKEKAENFHEKKIKVLRSDNGGEYCSKDFDIYLAEHGIKRQLTVPRTPQQNGVAERMNQTLMDMTRCILIESGVPTSFWADALNTACYLRNKCPTSALDGDIPERVWTGETVQLDYLRVFGCRVWTVVDPPRRKTKLEPKGIQCVLIGYPEGSKGYKLWDFANDKILVSRNVVFEESKFPLRKQGENSNTVNDGQDDVLLIVDTQVECNLNQDDNQGNPISTRHIDLFEDADDENFEVERTNLPLPTRSILRRSQRQAEKRDWQLKCNISKKQAKPADDPTTLREALSAPDAEEWRNAIREELEHFERNKTWKLVPRPHDRKVIDSRWVFKKKFDEDGHLDRYKARLVARGFSQVEGIDFKETFSPVVKTKSIRTLFAIAVEREWKIHHIDISAAYLNGRLKEDVYMEIPSLARKTDDEDDLVCLLQGSMYGLKQSGHEWNERLDVFLRSIGLKRSIADPCVYYNTEEGLILGVYVDDNIIVTKNDEVYENFKTKLQKEFQIKDLGEVSNVLSMCVRRTADGSIELDQTAYIDELLEQFSMTDAKDAATPLNPGSKFLKAEKTSEFCQNPRFPYREAIGGLLYVAGGTRPDLAHVTTYMSQFNENPTAEHWKGVKNIFRYLKKTRSRKLVYRKTGEQLEAYSDADWGSDPIDRRSFSGYTFKLAGAAVSWCSKKQRITAQSTVESEYISMCLASKEAVWFKNFLTEIGAEEFVQGPILLQVDNQGAICLAKNRLTSERNKHIDLKYFFLRELVDEKKVQFQYVPTEENPADILTKVVNKAKNSRHCEALGLCDKCNEG